MFEISNFNPDCIRNIVFDLGGVVIDLKRENAVKALEKLGLKNAGSLLGLYRQEQPFLGLETGHVTAAEFFETLRPLCGGAPDTDIQNAFCEFLIDIPAPRLQRLLDLRKAGYHVYALSNTNPVMYNSWITEHFRAGDLTVNDYFDALLLSFQELCCKPDVHIFEILLKRYGLNPAETLMLDDSPANCEAARAAGMHAVRVGLTPDNDMLAITDIFLNI